MTQEEIEFQSTLPRREATSPASRPVTTPPTFQSTLPRREATDELELTVSLHGISIHASPKGSDREPWTACPSRRNFNPRFPEGKRLVALRKRSPPAVFQSTLPRREATDATIQVETDRGISIHASPKGSDRDGYGYDGPRAGISIHASPKGSDSPCAGSHCRPCNFNPRFPEGKRPGSPRPPSSTANFNPRFPEGKRRSVECADSVPAIFQSTLPRREATARSSPTCSPPPNFNPRFPEGKRRHHGVRQLERGDFNPRFPEGKRLVVPSRWSIMMHFNPRFPEGKRRELPVRIACNTAFQSTLPRREATWTDEGAGRHPRYFNPRFPEGKRP